MGKTNKLVVIISINQTKTRKKVSLKKSNNQ